MLCLISVIATGQLTMTRAVPWLFKSSDMPRRTPAAALPAGFAQHAIAVDHTGQGVAVADRFDRTKQRLINGAGCRFAAADRNSPINSAALRTCCSTSSTLMVCAIGVGLPAILYEGRCHTLDTDRTATTLYPALRLSAPCGQCSTHPAVVAASHRPRIVAILQRRLHP